MLKWDNNKQRLKWENKKIDLDKESLYYIVLCYLILLFNYLFRKNKNKNRNSIETK